MHLFEFRFLFLILSGLWWDSHAAPARYRECHSPSWPSRRSVASRQAIDQPKHTPGERSARALGTPGTDTVACLAASCHVAPYPCLDRGGSAVLEEP